MAAPPRSAHIPRVVTLKQRGEIIDAATEHYVRVVDKPDCSHLVHDTYRVAGYPYRYASPSDLYVGTDDFLRVSRPQTGDLVVWPGHVGLVGNPQDHSFYSSVRTGLQTEDYTSPYWRRRGIPRFYRYRVKKPVGSRVATSRKGTQLTDVKDNWPTS